jgi:hypothetical protein
MTTSHVTIISLLISLIQFSFHALANDEALIWSHVTVLGKLCFTGRGPVGDFLSLTARIYCLKVIPGEIPAGHLLDSPREHLQGSTAEISDVVDRFTPTENSSAEYHSESRRNANVRKKSIFFVQRIFPFVARTWAAECDSRMR